MIAIRGLAVAAVLGAAAIAFSPGGVANAGDETFSLVFRYDAQKPALDNYLAFARQAERACAMPGLRALDARRHGRACVEAVLDELVVGLGRTELADLHFERTGRRDDSSRMLAAR